MAGKEGGGEVAKRVDGVRRVACELRTAVDARKKANPDMNSKKGGASGQHDCKRITNAGLIPWPECKPTALEKWTINKKDVWTYKRRGNVRQGKRKIEKGSTEG